MFLQVQISKNTHEIQQFSSKYSLQGANIRCERAKMGQNELSEPSEIVKNDHFFDFLGVKNANIWWKMIVLGAISQDLMNYIDYLEILVK